MQYRHGMALRTYYQQLLDAAGQDEKRVLTAFLRAGLPSSTFYRVRNGSHQSLRLSTARQVMNELHGTLHRRDGDRDAA